ncbi:MAG: nucleotidyltransferase domain-containing protein [Cyanobacteriota bacterium]|nr:nucleotidyltransferase domain-containing protein [Cyanobacteriota bacterium]
MDSTFNRLLDEFKNFTEIKAIALGGSFSAKTFDKISDIDIYVFVESDITESERERLVKKYSSKYETGGEYFGSGDEFYVDKSGVVADVMYWDINWFEDCINNVWFKFYPSNGYTTAFLYTLNNFKIIFDTDNWLFNLQRSIQTPYPQKLKQNIIKRNMMLMKDKPFASYYEQIEKAIKRNDSVSVNHRIAAFLASYFDVIFALNEMLHSGEKRLLKYCCTNCKILPADFEKNINELLIQPNSRTLEILDKMTENLRRIL